ncbi:MAG: hypothetical protein ACI906_000163 [Candidatus Latescibacterota bacterium]|jgi:hypothetical protein
MYQQELQALLVERVSFSDDDMGAAWLANGSGARGSQSTRSGMVFPRAVDSNHEQEPLVDIDRRLFVGLPANK